MIGILGTTPAHRELVRLAAHVGYQPYLALSRAHRALMELDPLVGDRVRLVQAVRDVGWDDDEEVLRLLERMAGILGPLRDGDVPGGPVVVWGLRRPDDLGEVRFTRTVRLVGLERLSGGLDFAVGGAASTPEQFTTWLRKQRGPG